MERRCTMYSNVRMQLSDHEGQTYVTVHLQKLQAVEMKYHMRGRGNMDGHGNRYAMKK